MPRFRTTPRYDKLFSDGRFNGTLLIGPDPLGDNFDYEVFVEARRKLRDIGLQMKDGKRGLEEYRKTFGFNGSSVEARIRLVLWRNYSGDLGELWHETLTNEDLIYLKTHAGLGSHPSLTKDARYFTDAMKEGFDRPRKQYQLFYLDCCKSEMYYKQVLRDFAGDDIDLILHKWFCDYRIIGPVAVLLDELMNGSDFETIVSRMNDEYGIPHFDVDDKPEDMRLDRKMVTYSIGQR